MSSKSNVSLLLDTLHKSSDIISQAYDTGRVDGLGDSAKRIVYLKQMRILTPDIHDTFQLRYSLKKFLSSYLNTSRLMQAGSDFGADFNRLDELVTRHQSASLDGRDDDKERYEEEIRESINDIAGAIEDELLHISQMVDSKFATVSTMSEKIKENEWYFKRTEALLKMLEAFSFSDLPIRLSGHRDLELALSLILTSKMTKFLVTLKSIYARLREFRYEFRNIEARAKLLRGFANHLSRNPAWEPTDWSLVESPPGWLTTSTPIQVKSSPDINSGTDEDFLVDIAMTLPEAKSILSSGRRTAGTLIDMSDPPAVVHKQSRMTLAVHAYFKAVYNSPIEISARRWWCENPSAMEDVTEDGWLHGIFSERMKVKSTSALRIRLLTHPTDSFDGNMRVSDILASRASPYA